MTLDPLLAARTTSSFITRSAVELLWTEADAVVRRLIAVTLLLVLGSAVVAGLAPVLLKVVIDRLELTQANTAYSVPFYLIVAYAFSNWLSRTMKELRAMFHGRIDQRIQRQVSHKLLQHVMSLPLRFHLNRRTGALSQTLTNGLIGYRMVLHHFMLTVLPVVVEVTAMCAVLVFLNQGVFLAIIGVSVLFYTLTFWTGISRIGISTRAVADAHIDANAVLTDSILNYETVKCFGAEAEVDRRFCRALIRTEDQWKQLYRKKMENGLVVAAIFALSLGASVYVAAREVQQGTMSIGEFVLVNAYLLQIMQPLEMIGFAFRDVSEGIAFVEKMTEVLDQRQEEDVITRHASPPTATPDLIFEGVSYSYDPGRRVLKDLNFIVPSGKTVGVVGTSGSGKSSLIRLLVRLVEPDRGTIYVNGVPLSDIPMAALRAAVAVVPQDIALFNETIAYNIGFGKRNSTRTDIVVAAKIAHIHDFITRLPDGYETMVGERGLKLSGGERQRVAIARAVIRKPKIFVFDEATSSLDSNTERAILRGVIKVARTTTTLIIAHRLSTVVHADEIVVLNHGSVVERGTHGQLLQRRGAYATMWRAQHATKQLLQDDAFIA
jgi:ATP-binding cassette subfamily B protein